MVPCERTRGNGHRLIQKWNILTIVRRTEHWHRMPREVVDSPFLEIFKTIWIPGQQALDDCAGEGALNKSPEGLMTQYIKIRRLNSRLIQILI